MEVKFEQGFETEKMYVKNCKQKLRSNMLSISFFYTGLRWQGYFFSERVGDFVLGLALSAHIKYEYSSFKCHSYEKCLIL